MRKRSLGGRLAPAAPPAMPVLLPAGAGSVVACEADELWLTRDGSWDDALLKPGQGIALVDDTPVLIRAFKQRAVRVAAEARREADWRCLSSLGRCHGRDPGTWESLLQLALKLPAVWPACTGARKR